MRERHKAGSSSRPFSFSFCGVLLQLFILIVNHSILCVHAKVDVVTCVISPWAPFLLHGDFATYAYPEFAAEFWPDLNVSRMKVIGSYFDGYNYDVVRSYIRMGGGSRCDLVIGPAYSDGCVALSPVIDKPMWIDFASTSTQLSSKSQFPNFLRVVSTDGQGGGIIANLLDTFGWKNIFVIKSDDSYGTTYTNGLTTEHTRRGGQVVRTFNLLADTWSVELLTSVMLQIRAQLTVSRVVVVVGVSIDIVAAAVRALNIDHDVTFIFSDYACSADSSWYSVRNAFCVLVDLNNTRWQDFTHRYTTRDDAAYNESREELFSAGYPKSKTDDVRNEYSSYTALSVDAVFYGLTVLQRYQAEHGGLLPADSVAAARYAMASNITFPNGMSGVVGVNANGDRAAFISAILNSDTSRGFSSVARDLGDGAPISFTSTVWLKDAPYDLRYLSGSALQAAVPSDRVVLVVKESLLPDYAWAIIAVAIALVLALVAFGSYQAYRYVKRGEATRHAPKNEAEPAAIVFTDIESSTALWAECPQQMVTALELHNTVIRRCIAAHRGYEVKTIGDSFMVAFKSALDAVNFSLAVQKDLFEADWSDNGDGSREGKINFFYEEQHATDEVESPPSVWNGLRVRIGGHHGYVSIRRTVANVEGGKQPADVDESAPYDYFGSTVNVAARVESIGHGGQVLLTKALMGVYDKARSESTRRSGQNNTLIATTEFVQYYMGQMEVKGVGDAIALTCIVPAELCQRRFKPLRFDFDLELNNYLSTGDEDDDEELRLHRETVSQKKNVSQKPVPVTQQRANARSNYKSKYNGTANGDMTSSPRGWSNTVPNRGGGGYSSYSSNMWGPVMADDTRSLSAASFSGVNLAPPNRPSPMLIGGGTFTHEGFPTNINSILFNPTPTDGAHQQASTRNNLNLCEPSATANPPMSIHFSPLVSLEDTHNRLMNYGLPGNVAEGEGCDHMMRSTTSASSQLTATGSMRALHAGSLTADRHLTSFTSGAILSVAPVTLGMGVGGIFPLPLSVAVPNFSNSMSSNRIQEKDAVTAPLPLKKQSTQYALSPAKLAREKDVEGNNISKAEEAIRRKSEVPTTPNRSSNTSDLLPQQKLLRRQIRKFAALRKLQEKHVKEGYMVLDSLTSVMKHEDLQACLAMLIKYWSVSEKSASELSVLLAEIIKSHNERRQSLRSGEKQITLPKSSSSRTERGVDDGRQGSMSPQGRQGAAQQSSSSNSEFSSQGAQPTQTLKAPAPTGMRTGAVIFGGFRGDSSKESSFKYEKRHQGREASPSTSEDHNNSKQKGDSDSKGNSDGSSSSLAPLEPVSVRTAALKLLIAARVGPVICARRERTQALDRKIVSLVEAHNRGEMLSVRLGDGVGVSVRRNQSTNNLSFSDYQDLSGFDSFAADMASLCSHRAQRQGARPSGALVVQSQLDDNSFGGNSFLHAAGMPLGIHTMIMMPSLCGNESVAHASVETATAELPPFTSSFDHAERLKHQDLILQMAKQQQTATANTIIMLSTSSVACPMAHLGETPTTFHSWPTAHSTASTAETHRSPITQAVSDLTAMGPIAEQRKMNCRELAKIHNDEIRGSPVENDFGELRPPRSCAQTDSEPRPCNQLPDFTSP